MYAENEKLLTTLVVVVYLFFLNIRTVSDS